MEVKPLRCPTCWRPIHEDTEHKGKVGGRPKVYCDDQCRKLYYWMGKAEDMVRLMAERCTPERWADFRRLMWGSLNFRAWNRGVKRKAKNDRTAPWR